LRTTDLNYQTVYRVKRSNNDKVERHFGLKVERHFGLKVERHFGLKVERHFGLKVEKIKVRKGARQGCKKGTFG